MNAYVVLDVQAPGDGLLDFGEHPLIPAKCERHLVQIGRQLREGEFAVAELFFETDDVVPRSGWVRV